MGQLDSSAFLSALLKEVFAGMSTSLNSVSLTLPTWSRFFLYFPNVYAK